jgi:hypothetical protein
MEFRQSEFFAIWISVMLFHQAQNMVLSEPIKDSAKIFLRKGPLDHQPDQTGSAGASFFDFALYHTIR